MTFEQLRTLMEGLGFRFQPAGSGSDLVGSFFRKIETARPFGGAPHDNFLEVEVWDRMRMSKAHVADRYSLEAKLVGEFMKDRWGRLGAYSIPPEEFAEQHRAIETALVRAWEAMRP